MFAKLIAVLCLMVMSFVVGFLIMIKGWGMEVQSWGWLIGGWMISIILTGLTQAVIQDKGE